MSDCVLRVEALSKRLGSTDALDGVTLGLHRHEVAGIVGGNGAGKSTLLKVLAGMIPADDGEIVVRGKAVRWRSAAEAMNAGIALMHQEPSLVPDITVAENILLGHEGAAVRLGFVRWQRLFALAQQQLDKVAAAISPGATPDSLSLAQRQLVSLARALAVQERTGEDPIIMLDEPTSTLDAEDLEVVLQRLEKLRSRASVLFVSHRLQEVLRVCDRVYVLRRGRCVAERESASCTVEELRWLMLGEQFQAKPARLAPAALAHAPVRLAARGLTRAGEYADISFALHEGEILGAAGLAGAGGEALCRTLFGVNAPDTGAIVLDGEAVTLRSPAGAAARGIAYLPADRSTEGIIGAMSVAENMTLAHLRRFKTGAVVDRRREKHAVAQWIERLQISTSSPASRAAELSGGNQQKLALAKWLIGERPRVLLLDHPLRGLDVAASAEICEALRELANEGVGVLMIADTLEELLALSDSVLVLRDGRICARLSVAEDQPQPADILARMI